MVLQYSQYGQISEEGRNPHSLEKKKKPRKYNKFILYKNTKLWEQKIFIPTNGLLHLVLR